MLLEGRAGARLVEKTFSSIAITRRERYTLLAIASLFDVLRGTPLWEDVHSLQQKLEQRMSPDERAEHAAFGERFAYIPDGGTKAYEGKEDILDALLTGVLSRRVVRFSYRDARGRARRGHLAPLTMALYKHGLYVVGCPLAEARDRARAPGRRLRGRALRRGRRRAQDELHRAGRASGSPRSSTARSASTSRASAGAWSSSCRRRRLRSCARVCGTRRRSSTELAGGKVRLAFPCASLAPVVSWVLEWGPHARAIEPPELVAEVVRELDAARAAYVVPAPHAP